jgi:hypothetical protein
MEKPRRPVGGHGDLVRLIGAVDFFQTRTREAAREAQSGSELRSWLSSSIPCVIRQEKNINASAEERGRR